VDKYEILIILFLEEMFCFAQAFVTFDFK